MITQMEGVRTRWFEKWGRYPEESDVDRMFNNAVPMQVKSDDNYVGEEFGVPKPQHMKNIVHWNP